MMAIQGRFCLFLLVSLLGVSLPLTAAEDPRRLSILNWADYLDPDLVTEFESRYNAKITEVYFDSDQERTQMLADSDGAGYDLILTAGVDLASYARKGWLAPLDQQAIPNLKHLAPIWRKAFEQAQTHAVPYFWGTVGIIYRSDLIKQPITGWKQLYQPAPELQGRIGMINDSRDLLGMALKSLGHPLNSGDKKHLSEVEKLLLDLQPHVRSYQYLMLDESSEIISGDIWASMIYSGDALMVQEHDENLVYVVPEEGSNIWVDYFSVGGKAKQPALAHQFLNFINEPQNAARMAQYVYYATPNLAAEQFLPAEFLEDPIIYPGTETLERSEFHQHLAPRVLRRRNAISAQILL